MNNIDTRYQITIIRRVQITNNNEKLIIIIINNR